MFSIVKRMIDFSGKYSGNLKGAIVISILEAITINTPILFVLYGLLKINEGSLSRVDIWIVGIGLVLSVALRAIFRRLIDGMQSGTGYKIFADERMKLGDYLKKLPMGYFTEGNIGNISAVLSSDIDFVEEHGMQTLSKIVSGSLGVIISAIVLTIVDYRIGIVVALTVVVSFVVLNRIVKKSKKSSLEKQEVQSDLVKSVIEYVKGISVIKAFNLEGQRSKSTHKSFKDARDSLINFEKRMVLPMIVLDGIIAVGTGISIFLAAYFVFEGSMDLPFAFMIMIFIYQLFIPLRALPAHLAMSSIMEASLDRYEKLMREETIKDSNKKVNLDSFDIEFQDVHFSYEKEEVLKGVNFKAEENTMTALVGDSGCGKTTIANLIARLWDIDSGTIKVGGIDIRDMSIESLLENISMVFQRVYLFNDTVEKNIKFANPQASHEEVVEVCKKARCHNFIIGLPEGYDTVIGEAGSTLSGGEKQRISIARAMLKDADIILLDEATASIDPDNERYIQEAINELVKNKTLIVIAHKLSTIKNADKILVIDEGKVVEEGEHKELIERKGKYYDFWQKRLQSRSWKIGARKAL
ncbi:ABC transporter ATP-binding protein [Senegalia sp. (in: firmicutes)]|uniref:ABC transporter ATP-binding protein n=1 Tax=Senegalia sp. (in: firmicutes) TaxID=1924098 RepID=UPI003F946024